MHLFVNYDIDQFIKIIYKHIKNIYLIFIFEQKPSDIAKLSLYNMDSVVQTVEIRIKLKNHIIYFYSRSCAVTCLALFMEKSRKRNTNWGMWGVDLSWRYCFCGYAWSRIILSNPPAVCLWILHVFKFIASDDHMEILKSFHGIAMIHETGKRLNCDCIFHNYSWAMHGFDSWRSDKVVKGVGFLSCLQSQHCIYSTGWCLRFWLKSELNSRDDETPQLSFFRLHFCPNCLLFNLGSYECVFLRNFFSRKSIGSRLPSEEL
jgi:hypothetical protein